VSIRLFRRLAATAATHFVSQPASLVTVIVVYLSVSLVLGSLWWAAAGANGGSVVGYPALALVWYAVAAEAAVIPPHPRAIEDIGDDIASGRLVTELLRPRSVLAVRVASQVGLVAAQAVVCAAVGVPLVWLLVGPPPDLVALALAGPALLLGVILNVVVQHAAAGSAFWVGDATAAWFLYQKLVFVLGGMLLPLEVLPSWLQTVAWALPFLPMIYAPARLAAGFREPWLLAVQLAWLGVAWLVAAAVFSRGERRLVGERA
jgi:ABC-2 type transport system permease protein